MILAGGGLADQFQQIAEPASSWWTAAWVFVQAQLALLPPWARVGLVVFVILVGVLRWFLPAWADVIRAKRSGR